MPATPLFRILFVNQDQLFEVYARSVNNSNLFGFVEIEEYVFGSSSQVLVDPSEEKLKNTFQDVKRSFIPMHSVVRIDQVDREGQSKISEARGNLAVFPYSQRRDN